jgi:hypothetical protein
MTQTSPSLASQRLVLAALRAFSQKGQGELERSFQVELARPQGTECTESELPALFPKLAAKYSAR